MAEKKTRGSSKLGAMTPADLTKAIKVTKESYKVERWWKYGQPAIDKIVATLVVQDMASAGGVVSGLLQHAGPQLAVGLEVFPLGIPFPDVVRINVTLEPALR